MSQHIPNIMIVDDDPNAHFFAKRALTKGAGISEFVITWNGQQALDKLAESCSPTGNKITHILLDIAMPVMDGFEFLDAFDSLPKHCTENVRVVLVSSSPNIDEHQRVNKHNCVSEIFQKALMPSDCPRILGLASV